jgi:hypothetical protein
MILHIYDSINFESIFRLLFFFFFENFHQIEDDSHICGLKLLRKEAVDRKINYAYFSTL